MRLTTASSRVGSDLSGYFTADVEENWTICMTRHTAAVLGPHRQSITPSLQFVAGSLISCYDTARSVEPPSWCFVEDVH